ncbi:MAG: glycerate kinase, partial [Bacteroidota bacterium]
TAFEVCEALKRGIQSSVPEADIISHPMADGGDGSLGVLSHFLPVQQQTLSTGDALGRKTVSTFFTMAKEENRTSAGGEIPRISTSSHEVLKTEKEGRTYQGYAYIELAEISGLAKLSDAEKNPLETSTFGTGQLMATAHQLGFNQQYLFLGGSSTHDLGLGIAAALGFQFLDNHGRAFTPTGGTLGQLRKIIPPDQLLDTDLRITLVCDVENPLTGPAGAAHTYALQKGADLPVVQTLETNTKHAASILSKFCGRDISQFPGGGAAGGIPAGLSALLDAQIQPGFEFIAETTSLEAQIKQADLVISGEGRLDRQTLQGKVPAGVASLCQKWDKPLVLVAGENKLGDAANSVFQARSTYSVLELASSVPDAMTNAEKYLAKIGQELLG